MCVCVCVYVCVYAYVCVCVCVCTQIAYRKFDKLLQSRVVELNAVVSAHVAFSREEAALNTGRMLGQACECCSVVVGWW